MKATSLIWVVVAGLLLGGCRKVEQPAPVVVVAPPTSATVVQPPVSGSVVQPPVSSTFTQSSAISGAWSNSVQPMVPSEQARVQTMSVVEVNGLTTNQWQACLDNPLLLDTLRTVGKSSWLFRKKTDYAYDAQRRVTFIGSVSEYNKPYGYAYKYTPNKIYVGGTDYFGQPITDTIPTNSFGFALKRSVLIESYSARATFRYKYDDEGNLINEDNQTITGCSGMYMQIAVDHAVAGGNRTSSVMSSVWGWGAKPTYQHTITYSYNLNQVNSGLPYLDYNLLGCSGITYEFGYYHAADYGKPSRNLIRQVIASGQDSGYGTQRQYVYDHFYTFDVKGRVIGQLISQRIMSGPDGRVYESNIRKHSYTYTD